MSVIKPHKEQGSALVYILIAIALLAALTSTFMDSSSQQTSSQSGYNLVTELKTQANTIRSAIEECVVLYPGGDNALAGLATVGGETPVHPYPLNPWNSYLLNPAVGYSIARDIRCPGNPGNSNNHAKMFSGTSGKYLPSPPALFGEWFYYNGPNGVFVTIMTNKTDSYIEAALRKLDAEYSKCESQYIDARSGIIQITAPATSWACAAGNQCLRIWIKATGSAIYPGETGCP